MFTFKFIILRSWKLQMCKNCLKLQVLFQTKKLENSLVIKTPLSQAGRLHDLRQKLSCTYIYVFIFKKKEYICFVTFFQTINLLSFLIQISVFKYSYQTTVGKYLYINDTYKKQAFITSQFFDKAFKYFPMFRY